MHIINFISNWQQLIGALAGAIIAILGSIWINNYFYKRAERKKQYSNLLLILSDIQRFIGKCELYLNSDNKKIVPYDKIILNDKINYFEPTHFFDLKPEVYNSIDHIYSVANVIAYNLRLSEVLEINVKKKKEEEIHSQKNVISNRYWETLVLMRFYLKGIYKNFNIIAKEVKKLSSKYGHLNPIEIKFYKKDYVEEKNKEYGLDKVK